MKENTTEKNIELLHGAFAFLFFATTVPLYLQKFIPFNLDVLALVYVIVGPIIAFLAWKGKITLI